MAPSKQVVSSDSAQVLCLSLLPHDRLYMPGHLPPPGARAAECCVANLVTLA